MPDFSHLIPESHQNVSSRVLETLLQTQHDSSFTGLMRLNHFPDENLIFSFLDGEEKKLYRCRDGAVEILPRQDWEAALNGGSDFVGFLSLPIEAMRFMRVAQEAPVRQVERSTLSAEQLTSMIEKWVVEHEPGIVHVRGESINRCYLIAGDSTPIIEELSLLDGEARFSLNDASFPKTLPKLDYQVVRYVSVHDHDVWREHELRLAFYPFIRILLNRFGEVAGRVLTERLCVQLTFWAHERGWNIDLSSNGIINRQYFIALEDAIGFYADLLRHFQDEASPAIGSRMAREISYEVLNKLDSVRRDLLTHLIFSRLEAGDGIGMIGR